MGFYTGTISQKCVNFILVAYYYTIIWMFRVSKNIFLLILQEEHIHLLFFWTYYS